MRSIRYARIWRDIWNTRGAEIPDHVIDRLTPSVHTTLVECRECGLQYFSPLVPGDGEFYAALSTTGVTYYEGDRWEFGVVRARVGEGDDIVDVGCGQGDFLRSLGARPGRTVGVDHNPNLHEALRATGVEAFAVDVGAFAEMEQEAFGVVCMFQTMEHLARLEPVLSAGRRCLRPGGRLYVSVPNRRRTGVRPEEPLDCPPHHMSRWHERQFGELAQRHGFELTAVMFEPVRYGQVESVYFDAAYGSLRRFMTADAGRFVARVYRKLVLTPRWYDRGSRSGRWSRLGMTGHTMMAELRRPEAIS